MFLQAACIDTAPQLLLLHLRIPLWGVLQLYRQLRACMLASMHAFEWVSLGCLMSVLTLRL